MYGGKLRRILIHVDPVKLEAHGLSPLDLVPELKKSSTLLPAGAARLGDNEFILLSNAVPRVV